MKKAEFEKLTPDQVLELINTQEQQIKDAEERVKIAEKAHSKQSEADAITIEALKAEVEAKDELLLELNSKLSAAEASSKGGSSKPTVKVDKKTYTVNCGVHLEKEYSAQDIADDPKVAKAILEIEGQTILTEEV